MADADAAASNTWNGDAARTAARDDEPQWNGGRSPSPRGAATPPRRERERSRSPARRNEDDRPSRADRSGETNPGNNLHVSGLSTKVTDRDLEEAFGKFGAIEKAQVMYDPHTREPRGFAFVTFVKPEEAEAAMAALNGTDFQGRRMTVDKARRGRARTPTPGRYFGPPKRGDEPRGGGPGYGRGPYDRGYGPPPRGGYPPPFPPRDPYDRYGMPPPMGGRPLSPPSMRDPYDRYARGPPPPRDYPPRDRDYLPPPRGIPGDYPPPRDYPRGPPPADYPPPRGGYRDLSPPPRGRYDDVPPPPRGGVPPRGYGDLPPPPRGGPGRYDDLPPRRY
ncbi:uncharacterized protein PFL1_01529 [Pseudozyma flocculosa PF-1]|uniref:Related to Transformer-2 protein homolog n=1 Tax=Pseudozyma flocculosa TaxID=84751 RepID=A0A5C3EYY1_9BASI|nr:uncharacterized protein PFL1_01529 [Pseudozyma flocculosa PF-1]EPQ30628.1 hypothetical protein PFL1_01529 [Pseudozyma flocculosa PF-1]SPO37040.1 related to Transformer-2 protein homolog [Pseudozyma flocculosa]